MYQKLEMLILVFMNRCLIEDEATCVTARNSYGTIDAEKMNPNFSRFNLTTIACILYVVE